MSIELTEATATLEEDAATHQDTERAPCRGQPVRSTVLRGRGWKGGQIPGHENANVPEMMGRKCSPVEQVAADRFQLTLKDDVRPSFPPAKSPTTLDRGEPGDPTLMPCRGLAVRWTWVGRTLSGTKRLVGEILAPRVFHFTVSVPADT